MHYQDEFLDFHWIDKKTKIDRSVVFTEHVIDELEKYDKLQEFALDVLQKGREAVISKRSKKYESHYSAAEKMWNISFARRNGELL